jgi:hypothetical protein
VPDGFRPGDIDLKEIDVAVTDYDSGTTLARGDLACGARILIVTGDTSESSVRTAIDAGGQGIPAFEFVTRINRPSGEMRRSRRNESATDARNGGYVTATAVFGTR